MANSPVAETIGSRIKARRRSLNMNQSELAKALDVGQSSIAQYESGNREINATDLVTLADVLKVPVSYFFADANPMKHVFTLTLHIDELVTNEELAQVRTDLRCGNEDMTFKHTNVDMERKLSQEYLRELMDKMESQEKEIQQQEQQKRKEAESYLRELMDKMESQEKEIQQKRKEAESYLFGE